MALRSCRNSKRVAADTHLLQEAVSCSAYKGDLFIQAVTTADTLAVVLGALAGIQALQYAFSALRGPVCVFPAVTR